MTTIKIKKSETHIVLDFDNARHSKNKIKQILRNLEFESYKAVSGPIEFIFIDNDIKVGIFTINILLSPEEGCHRLKDFRGGMFIMICEENRENTCIKLHTHPLFKNQYWQKYNVMGQFKIKHLTDAIYHCRRLNSLLAFI